jgi:hypothetical protein
MNLIDRTKYEELLARLLLMNYRVLPVSGGILLQAVKLCRFSFPPLFVKAINDFRRPGFRLDRIVNVLADFVKLVWLEGCMQSTKQTFVQLILGVLLARDPRGTAVQFFDKCLEERFKLLQPQLDEIKDMIRVSRSVRGIV